MSGLETASALFGFFSLVLLLSNYKKLRERILKINLSDPIIKDDMPIGTQVCYENLSDYYIPDVEIKIQGFIGSLHIFEAARKIDFDPHDKLDAVIDLSKRLEERGLLSLEEISAKGLRISIECNYYQIILWNRLFLFKQRIYRKYIWDAGMKKWRHPHVNEW